MLTTLFHLKQSLGITGSDEDEALKGLIARTSEIVRNYLQRDIGYIITAISAAAAPQLTIYGHGFDTGDVLSIADSLSTPSIDNATATVTRVDEDNVTISTPTVTTAADENKVAAYATRQYTEYYRGNGSPILRLRQYPVISVASVNLDNAAHYGEASGAFGSSSLLTAGTDFHLVRSQGARAEEGGSGMLERPNGVWTGAAQRHRGRLTQTLGSSAGNIKVVYTAGYKRVPYAIQEAAIMIASQIRSYARKGGILQQESLEYYSYARMAPDVESKMLASAAGMLKQYKAWVF